MRFKQALSRKLAAALSAVMILSTIAPTSVPVLAAAPDDVLVDSNVEYDLQDAGSEDVLLDSAESSLAEETDTLEVAGEELLSNEAASDEVLVDSAEEVLSEETGTEPVEVGETPETVETPEEANELGWKIPITVSGGGIIKSVSWNYFGWSGHANTVSSDGGTIDMSDATSGKKTIEVLSQNGGISYDGIIITGVSFNGRAATPGEAYQDGTYNINVSANKLTGWTGDGKDIQSKADFNSQGLIGSDAATPGSAVPSNYAKFVFKNGDADNKEAVYFEAEQIQFSGKLKLKVVSNNIIRKIQISGATPSEYIVSDDSVKEFTITNQAKDAVKVTLGAGSGTDVINTTAFPLAAYNVSFNGTGIKKDIYTPGTSGPKTLELKADGDVEATFEATPKDDYNKKGTLTINVLSENTVGGKVVSINQVKVTLGNYAIEFKGGAWQEATYKASASTNNLNVKGWGNKIQIPYTYAKDVKVIITDETQPNGKHTKYKYYVGNKEFYYNDLQSFDLGKTGTDLTIGVKQVGFDPEVEFTTTSANILDNFKVESFDGNNVSLGEKTISAVNDSITKTVEFTDAKKIKIAFGTGKFNPKAGLPSDVTDRGWVYQITQGDKTKSLVRNGDYVEFEADKDGNIAPITVKTVPNVKITLSANANNRPANEKIMTNFNYWDENEFNGTIALTDSTYGSFYVEPGKVVSVNNFKAQQPYLFPYVVEGTEDVDHIGTFTLGSFESDTPLNVDTKEFGLVQSVIIGKVNGKGSVSINGFADAKTTDTNPKSTLSNNVVFSLGTNLDVSFKLDCTEDMDYTFNTISYGYYNSMKGGSEVSTCYGQKDTHTEKNITVTKDSKGNTIYTLSIPYKYAYRTFLKDGKIEFTVNEYENAVENKLTLKSNPTGKISDVKVTANGGVVLKELDVDKKVAYNTPLTVKATPAKGWKLLSVNIVVKAGGSVSQDQITDITDAKTLAEFTGNGYSGTKNSPFLMTRDTVITFNTEKDYAINAQYVTGDTSKTVETDKKGQYLVSHQRKLNLTYVEGDGAPAKFDYDILLGSKSIKSTISGDAAKLVGNVLTLDPSNKEIVGKTVTVKFFTGDGSKTDTSVRTAVLVIDSENTGIKFKNAEEVLSLGTTGTFKPTVTGSPSVQLVVTPAIAADQYGWDASKKTFTFTTKRTDTAQKYTVKFLNSGDTTIEYAKLVIDVNTDAVKKAEAPKVSITGTSNRTLTVSLKANKIDTKIDGLAFKVKVTTSGQKKGYFEASKTVYVPITEASKTIDMMTAAAAADDAKKVDGDTDAKFTVEAWIVQVKAADIEKATEGDQVAISTASTKADPISPKEGKVFETNLKLAKLTKGNAYTNMGKSNPYKISVKYSKNTAVQQISKVEIFDKSGNVPYDNTDTLINPTDYLDFDNYTIDFMPAGKALNHETTYANQLKDGTYTIKAYALEPNSVEVSATIKVKVVQGIVTLGLQDSPAYIYKKAGKKATMQITALDTTKGLARATKAKKVEYSIVDAPNATGKAPAFAGKNGVDINKKNGKITVAKDFMIDGQTFYVKAVATDFATTKCEPVYSKQITIKTQYNSELGIAYSKPDKTKWWPYYTEASDIVAGTTMDDLGSSYNVHELFGVRGGDEKYAYVTYVTVYDKEKKANTNAKFVPATFKVSGAAKLIETVTGNADGDGTVATVAKIGLNKTGTFKISAKANDGSDREIKNYAVTVRPEGTMGFGFVNSSGAQIGILGDTTGKNAGKIVSINNYGAEGDYIDLSVAGYYKDTEDNWMNTFVNNKVSVKNGKVTKSYKVGVCDVYRIVPTDTITTVTITNTDTKTKLEVPVTNHAIGNKKAKTKVTVTGGVNGKGQIYSFLDFSKAKAAGLVEYKNNSCNKVTYNVTTAKKDTYALVSVVKEDDKKNVGTYNIRGALYNNAAAGGNLSAGTGNAQVDLNTFAFKLSGTSFSVDWITSDMDNGQYSLNPGTYKISITPAEKTKEGNYVATGKALNVNVSAKKAPKANVKPKATITNVTANTATIEAGNYKNYIAKGGVKFTELLNVNTKGKHNNFHTNFQIDPDAKKNNVLNFIGDKPIDPKANKEEFQGWVEYKYQNLDGTTATQQIKVTIKATSQMKKK